MWILKIETGKVGCIIFSDYSASDGRYEGDDNLAEKEVDIWLSWALLGRMHTNCYIIS